MVQVTVSMSANDDADSDAVLMAEALATAVKALMEEKEEKALMVAAVCDLREEMSLVRDDMLKTMTVAFNTIDHECRGEQDAALGFRVRHHGPPRAHRRHAHPSSSLPAQFSAAGPSPTPSPT